MSRPGDGGEIVNGIGRFIDSDFAATAGALGWTAIDLFGCDRDRPVCADRPAGLLWLLAGARLVALTENTATIEMPTGARQIWRRRAREPGRVLPLELVSCLLDPRRAEPLW